MARIAHIVISNIPHHIIQRDNRNPSLFTYDTANRLLEEDQYTYTYDFNCNLTSKTDKTDPTDVTTYTYSTENQLIQVTSHTSYPNGHRQVTSTVFRIA